MSVNAKNRIFTNEEIARLCELPHDAFIRCMEEGKKDKAKEWLKNIFILYEFAFDHRILWDDVLMDGIYKKLGPDAVYDVMKDRGFSEKSITPLRLTKEKEDEVLGYVDANDVGACKRWMTREYKNMMYAHNLRIEWETILMTYLYKNVSPEYEFEVMDSIIRPNYEGLVREIADNNFDMRLRAVRCIWGLHTHGAPIEMWEDDEKVTIKMTYCNSGTMLLDKGIYGAPHNCTLCHDICPNTFSVDNFPIYCSHAPIQEFTSIDIVGFPIAINTPWDECDEPGYQFAQKACHYHIYKDPKDIPQRVFDMLGKERPSTYYFPGYEGFEYTPMPKQEGTQDWPGSLSLYWD